MASPANASIQSTFDTSAGGWTVAQDTISAAGPASYVRTGGNPGGHILGTDAVNDPMGFFTFDSPPSWAGDRSADYDGRLSFDMKHADGGNPPGVAISDTAGNYLSHAFDVPPASAAWTHYSVPLFEGGGWTYVVNGSSEPVSQRGFIAILRSMEGIEILGDLAPGSDTTSLDNVRFQGPPGSDAPCRGRTPTRIGTPGPDYLRGGPGRDVISGLGGPDTIIGLGGRDIVCAGAGRTSCSAATERTCSPGAPAGTGCSARATATGCSAAPAPTGSMGGVGGTSCGSEEICWGRRERSGQPGRPHSRLKLPS